jgi:hypothetical protein
MWTDQGASPDERRHRSDLFQCCPGPRQFSRVRCTTGIASPAEPLGHCIRWSSPLDRRVFLNRKIRDDSCRHLRISRLASSRLGKTFQLGKNGHISSES